MDPLYTYFGNKNTTGVIGSMIGAQVGVTVAAALLHHIGKKHRWVRWGTDVLLAEKTGANIYGAVHNFGVLQTMSAQRAVPHKKLADQ